MNKNDKAVWIWHYGDYELYHSTLLHSRREEFGMDFPPFFPVFSVCPMVVFYNVLEVPEDDYVTVKLNGKGRVRVDSCFYSTENPIKIPKGKREIEISVINAKGLPAIYVSGKFVKSGKDWKSSVFRGDYKPVGCSPAYYSAKDDVEKFPFKYKKILPVSCKNINNGILFDFGKEYFGNLVINDLKQPSTVYYGESQEEALSLSDAILLEKLQPKKRLKLRSRAFRYVFIDTVNVKDVYAFYEYLPYKDKGSFTCDDESVNNVFNVALHTFRLCSREFYLDGIKRDRWVWSGDAYQSFLINRYLCNDNEIIKRTIIALLGKPPYTVHVNTINDYSAYLIISVYDYYFNTGDEDFVKAIYQRVKDLFNFIKSRLNEDGFVVERNNDWIFIDWANLDKEGPHCFEQILLYKVYKCMRELAKICNDDDSFIPDEKELKEKIYRKYYKKELGGFIDGFTSGKNKISRHQNVMAILLGFTTEQENKLILKKVLLNDDVEEIKTPYFKFFELCAFCETGKTDIALDMIESYWGGMLKDGATSFYEQFDPNVKTVEKYAMYGNKFAKSLCHAWGSGPIALLLKYVAGVKPTATGYKSFEIKPCPAKYKKFSATVPVNEGTVKIDYDDGGIKVKSSVDGGTLVFNGKKYAVKKNVLLSVKKA